MIAIHIWGNTISPPCWSRIRRTKDDGAANSSGNATEYKPETWETNTHFGSLTKPNKKEAKERDSQDSRMGENTSS